MRLAAGQVALDCLTGLERIGSILGSDNQTRRKPKHYGDEEETKSDIGGHKEPRIKVELMSGADRKSDLKRPEKLYEEREKCPRPDRMNSPFPEQEKFLPQFI